MYKVIKRYGYDQGWTCCFRQWRTDTHCKFLHAYSFAVELSFAAITLNDKNWALGFGDLKEIKQWLQDHLDHRTHCAHDDPFLETFRSLDRQGLIQLVEVDHVGTEKLAERIFNHVNNWLSAKKFSNGVILEQVKVNEHDGNGAAFTNPTPY